MPSKFGHLSRNYTEVFSHLSKFLETVSLAKISI